MKTRYIHVIITGGAVVTSIPRWVGALMTSDGTPIPEAWAAWLPTVNAAFAVGMALVEGLAFMYVMDVRRRIQRTKVLDALILLTFIDFVFVLMPHIYYGGILRESMASPAQWFWAFSVAASTMLVVAMVGHASGQEPTEKEDALNTVLAQATREITELRGQVAALQRRARWSSVEDALVECIRISPGISDSQAAEWMSKYTPWSVTRQRVTAMRRKMGNGNGK